MLLALCNLNPTVGAIRSNADKLIRFAHEADAKQCDIAVFSEMFLAGYPTEDLVLWPDFVAQQWQELCRIRDEFKSSKMMLAFGLAVEFEGKVHNCAALVQSGKILGIVPKQELPTYNVFYEGRIFTPGLRGKVSKVHDDPFGDMLFDTRFGNLALEICEDLWIDDGPLMSRVKRGAELCINISASPWRIGIPEARRELLKSRS
ncbi:NAD(+) synthase, partial [bacterium]|nr:NAD(+) synthase [bacterium]